MGYSSTWMGDHFSAPLVSPMAWRFALIDKKKTFSALFIPPKTGLFELLLKITVGRTVTLVDPGESRFFSLQIFHYN